MSPEQRAEDRARGVVVLLPPLPNVESVTQAVRLIATAIKEAEDAKLDQAILFCEGEAKAKDLPGDDPRFYAGRREAGRRLVRLVRTLKSQEP